jgi:hypothetical protein
MIPQHGVRDTVSPRGQHMRTVRVDAARLERWLTGFCERHGPCKVAADANVVQLVAEDGAQAVVRVPFPPLLETTLAGLVAHGARERTVGALLIRRGGVAVGVFEGRRLAASKIETAYVQGRTKAGGWSQQRYARRRGNQARKLGETAAGLMVTLVLPRADQLAALATGGDRESVDAVLDDPRLSSLRRLALERVYPVADPRHPVLVQFPEQFLAIEIELNEVA